MALKARFAFFLAPTVVQALLSFLTLPLATLILGPREYGAFALVAATTGLGGSLATSASGMLLPAVFRQLNAEEKSNLLRSLLLCSIAVAGVFAAALLAIWPQLSERLEGLELVAPLSLALAIAAMFCTLPWSVGYLVVILDGRAKVFSVVVISAAAISTITLLICLFWLHLGIEALFASHAASAITLLLGSVFVLVPHLVPAGRDGGPAWRRRIMRMTLIAGTGSSVELLQTVAERFVLARFTGVHGVGIFAHGHLYRNILFAPLKAASNSIWPRSLDEAKNLNSTFESTRRVWGPLYLAVVVVGVVAAFLGDDFVALLTHGKFREAGQLIPAFIVILLVQFSGKPQVAVLYANEDGEFLGKLMGLCAGAAIVALLLMVPSIGMWGAIIALGVQHALYRIGVHWRARRHRTTPFQDEIVLRGAVAIVVASLVDLWFSSSPVVGVVFAMVATTLVLLLERRTSTALFMALFRERKKRGA